MSSHACLGAPLMGEQGNNKKGIAPTEVGQTEPCSGKRGFGENTCDCPPARFVRIVLRYCIASEGMCDRLVDAELLQIYTQNKYCFCLHSSERQRHF